jgi:hypothetical protein
MAILTWENDNQRMDVFFPKKGGSNNTHCGFCYQTILTNGFYYKPNGETVKTPLRHMF